MRSHPLRAVATATVLILIAAGCGDDTSPGAETPAETTPVESSTETPSTTEDSGAVTPSSTVEPTEQTPSTTVDSGPETPSTTVDSGPETPSTTVDPSVGRVIELVVTGGELEGGARRESVALGENVTIRVTGDSSDELHVHVYDVFVPLVDGSGEATFEAAIPGVFEIELEGSGSLLVQLEVS